MQHASSEIFNWRLLISAGSRYFLFRATRDSPSKQAGVPWASKRLDDSHCKFSPWIMTTTYLFVIRTKSKSWQSEEEAAAEETFISNTVKLIGDMFQASHCVICSASVWRRKEVFFLKNLGFCCCVVYHSVLCLD